MAYTWPPTLAEAKSHLNITTTADDTELQGVLDAAVEIIEDYVGAVASASVTDQFVTMQTAPWPYTYGTWPRYSYGARAVDLRTSPVQSVQSVVISSMDGSNQMTLPTSAYRLDPVAGSVTVVDSTAFFGPLVTVTYTAGRATVPASVRLAALKLVWHMWRDQRGAGVGRSVPGGMADDYGAPVTAHLIPWEVEELLARYRKPATVA